MKILLDENLPHALRSELTDVDVYTVQFMKWTGIRNGVLLAKAAASGFDAMVTMDGGMPYQHNLNTLPLAVILLSAPSNDMDDLLPLIPRIRIAINSFVPKTVIRIR